MKKKPVVKEVRAPYAIWENDYHTIDVLESLIRQAKHEPESPMVLAPGEIYALRRAIRLIKTR